MVLGCGMIGVGAIVRAALRALKSLQWILMIKISIG